MSMWRSAANAIGEARDRVLIAAAYLYLVIPIVIFLFGWTRLPIALLVTAGVLFGTWKSLRGFGYLERNPGGGAGPLLVPLLIVAAWVLLSGIDEFGFQNSDFTARNAIFHDLIQHPWPVTYDYRLLPGMQAVFGDTGALVYYFAYWLPCALVGKVLGWHAANHALLAWSILGAFLSLMLVYRFVGSRSVWLAVAFIAWSGMDVLGTLLYSPPSAAIAGQPLQARELIGQTLALVFGQQQLEAWVSRTMEISIWQYSSLTTQLFWVFNQAIPAWIVTALLLNQQDRKSVIHTYSLALLFAPLPALGLLPFLVYRLISTWSPFGHAAASGAQRSLLAETVSIQNVVSPAMLAFVALAFLGSQQAAQTKGFVWQYTPFSVDLVIRYLAFCVLEFLVFGLLVLRPNQDRALLILAMVVLLVLPVYVFGLFSDLVMRGSIPALLVLFMIGFRNLHVDPPPVSARSRASRSLLIAILLVGMITPLHEIQRSTQAIVKFNGMPKPDDEWQTFAGSADLASPPSEWSNYVAARPQETLFFSFLARH